MQSRLTAFVAQATAWCKSRYRLIVAFAIGFLLALGGYWLVAGEVAEAPQPVVEVEQSETTLSVEAAAPIRIKIPEIGVDAAFEDPLGLNDDQTIEVPDAFDTVGWYKYGPKPGELGPAVVLGHVDSYEGAAVFYLLGQLEKGDEIIIETEEGEEKVFIVEMIERHEQSGFPTAKVYSDLDYPGLRLITCSGVYDHNTLRYSHNTIVFARLVE